MASWVSLTTALTTPRSAIRQNSKRRLCASGLPEARAAQLAEGRPRRVSRFPLGHRERHGQQAL
eukprot:880815-Prymnesium_polylepis.1